MAATIDLTDLPGGNVTGLSNLFQDLGGKQLELLKEAFPKISRVSVLWDPANASSALWLGELKVAAGALRITLHPREAHGPDDLEPAFAATKRDGANAFVVLLNALVSTYRTRIVNFAAKTRLSAMYPNSSFTNDGGLMSYGANPLDLVAFCLPSNPLARKKLSLKELGECPLVLRRGGRLEKILMNLGYKMNIALRCDVSGAVRAAVRLGMGVGILYRNAVASRVARGNLRLINVPELKQLGIKSFITYDRRKPLGTMAQDFLQILRDQKNPPMAANDRGVHIGNARRLALH